MAKPEDPPVVVPPVVPPVHPPEGRKIIAISAVVAAQTIVPKAFASGVILIALCNDGTVWTTPFEKTKWEQFAPPPGVA